MRNDYANVQGGTFGILIIFRLDSLALFKLILHRATAEDNPYILFLIKYIDRYSSVCHHIMVIKGTQNHFATTLFRKNEGLTLQ